MAIQLDLFERALAEIQRQIRGSVSETEGKDFGSAHLTCAALQRDGEVVAQIGDARGSTPGKVAGNAGVRDGRGGHLRMSEGDQHGQQYEPKAPAAIRKDSSRRKVKSIRHKVKPLKSRTGYETYRRTQIQFTFSG